jgi:hypothetical protein
MLGSLTYVLKHSNDGHLDESYFFNKDGRLAAQARRFDTRSGSRVYVAYETVYYGARAKETRRVRHAYYDGKFSTVRKGLTPPLAKPVFSFSDLSGGPFKNAGEVDAEQLGICIIDLSDGYGSQTRMLNFPAQPLDVYRAFPLPMNHRNFDSVYSVQGKAAGSPVFLGTLAGKKVYAVKYPSGLTAVLVSDKPIASCRCSMSTPNSRSIGWES